MSTPPKESSEGGTPEEVRYRQYVLDKIERGRADIAAGRYRSQQDARRYLERRLRLDGR